MTGSEIPPITPFITVKPLEIAPPDPKIFDNFDPIPTKPSFTPNTSINFFTTL